MIPARLLPMLLPALFRGVGEAVEVPTYGKSCSVLAFSHRSPQAVAKRSVQGTAPRSVTAVECCQ